MLQALIYHTPAIAQPVANPAMFATGNNWVALFGILFFTTPIAWAIFSSIGEALGDKVRKSSFAIFWRHKFPVIGLFIYIVMVTYIFCKWSV